MRFFFDNPILPFLLGLALMSGTAWLGVLRKRRQGDDVRANSLAVLQGAALTLFGLILGFSFSVAISRYDKRVDLAVEEANSMGTVWLRAATLPAPLDGESRALLRQYVAARLELRSAGTDRASVEENEKRASELQRQLWALAVPAASSRPDPVLALYLASLNEMFDLQTLRREAKAERLPPPVWLLLFLLGAFAHLLLGASVSRREIWLLYLLPLVIAASFFLLADIDSPRSGLIRVEPSALPSLYQEMQPAPGK